MLSEEDIAEYVEVLLVVMFLFVKRGVSDPVVHGECVRVYAM